MVYAMTLYTNVGCCRKRRKYDDPRNVHGKTDVIQKSEVTIRGADSAMHDEFELKTTIAESSISPVPKPGKSSSTDGEVVHYDEVRTSLFWDKEKKMEVQKNTAYRAALLHIKYDTMWN